MGAAMADQQQQQQQQQQQKAKSFPAGLRVLVVDDDPTCLKILDRMLKKCLYEVTTCSRAKAALALLRERKNGFDLVISDVYMPDLDGFELLERVGLEMDLPVIMMSADGGTSTVMKGIKHGACDYLIKPVRVEELQNIWQHVVRKKRNGSKDFDHSTSFDESEKHKKGSDDVDYASSANEGTDGNWKLVKKRKDAKDEEDDVDQEADDPSASKKPRVVWSVELHQQFVNAVNQLGIDKAVPKRILELMHVQGLTRENVASHLQKYRLYLKRLSGVTQQQNGMNSSFGGGTDGSIGHMGLLGRMDLPSFPSNGQISPQALAALPADILGSVNASNGLGMTNVDQSLLLQASFPDNSNLSRRFGPTLMNSQGNLLQGFPSCFESKQYSFAQQQQIPSFVNMCSSVNDTAGAGFSTLQPHVNIGTGIAGVDRSRVLNGTDCSNPQKNALLMQFRQQRHQSNQQQHQLPAPGLQQTSFGQNKSPQLNNGQSNFCPPGLVSMPPVSNDIKSRAPLLSIANSRGCLGNSISVISGPEEVSNPSPAGYGVMASEDNVAESIGRIPASDYKSQNVPMLSGNEYSLASAACLSSSPSVSVDRENGMLGGLTDGIRPSNLNNSAVSFHASHMSNETDRQSWQPQSSVTQDSGQPAMFLNARHPRINGTQAINGVPIQDTTEARQHAFVAKGSSLANRLGHNSLPRMLNSTHPALVEADKKLRVKEEHMTELPFNLKNESALLSEPFTDDLMNMFLNQQTGGPGPDDFNLDPF